MKIVLVNGAARAGKDTFVQICKRENSNGEIWHISTVDLIKKAAKILGWNDVKDEKGRKFLSDLKDLSSAYSDLSSRYIEEKIEEASWKKTVKAIFIDVREPEELARLKEKFDAITLFIDNKRVNKVTSNHADMNVENFNYDYYIDNNRSLLELTQKAVEFLREIQIL